MRRRPRGVAAKRLPLDVTKPCDRNGLYFIGLVGYASTPQIAEAGEFSSEYRARERIRLWLDAGLVRVSITESQAPNLVALTAKGLAIVEQECGSNCGARLAGNIPSTFRHHLLQVDARLWTAAAGRAGSLVLLAWSSGRSHLAEDACLVDAHIVADAVATVEVEGARVDASVEIDCGTEGARFLMAKLAKYAVWLRGPGRELWLVDGSDAATGVRLATLVREAGVATGTRLFTRALLRERPALQLPARGVGSMWRPLTPEIGADLHSETQASCSVAARSGESDVRPLYGRWGR